MADLKLPLVYCRTILFVLCYGAHGVVLRDSDGDKDMQAGFTLRHFMNTGLISVQCNCQQLPKETRTVFSVTIKRYESVSKYLPVASLYSHGELLKHLLHEITPDN